MHLYFIPRGILQNVNLFDMFLQTHMFLWKRKNLTTKEDEVCQVQGSLRKIGFIYEYVFPEECLAEVLTMLNIPEDPSKHEWNLGRVRNYALRKMLGHGVKPVPKYKRVPTNKYVEMSGVALYLIGVKKDKRAKAPEWGYEQELL